ncbi:hypothetical protein [Pseudomonas sp. bs2935]|uniref:hypothetical protein n=1 Tax=Pseudomonas sp. bs2935 TaxID=1761895 RepID=UPI0012FE7A90|nr:hypothetical protein [Pseudomonas sp. bs2935]
MNATLSPDSYKSWLTEGSQNLRSFAEAFLQGIVTPTLERQGLDYLFKIEGNSQQINQSFGGALWKAFCTTRPAQTILFDTNQNALSLVPAGTEEAGDAQVIPSISEPEFKTMCLDFTDFLGQKGVVSERLIDTAKAYEPHSYPIWVASLKAEPGLFKEWGIFRIQWVKDLFAERVGALTGDEATRARLNSEFDSDHIAQRKKKLSTISPQVQSTVAPTASVRMSNHATRLVLAKALDTLDDAQLAKILVPIDVVAALIAQLKH